VAFFFAVKPLSKDKEKTNSSILLLAFSTTVTKSSLLAKPLGLAGQSLAKGTGLSSAELKQAQKHMD